MTDANIAMKNELKNCFDVKGNLSFKKINQDLLERIILSTKFLDEYFPKIQERVYCILNDIDQIIKCPITNEKLKYSPQHKKYSNSRTFSQQNKKITNTFNFKDKNKEDLEYIITKFSNQDYTLLSKYQCIELYSSLTPNKNSRINVSIAKSYLNFICSVFYYTLFFDNFNFNISERIYCIKHNISQHMTDSYGIKLNYINIEIGYSRFPTKQAMYDFHLKSAHVIISENFEVNSFIKDDQTGTTNRINVTCKICNYSFSPFFKNGLWKNIYCPGCNGLSNRSKMELQMLDYLRSLGITNIVENDRTILNGREIDIYLPDFNIGIEMCGILWHSFGTSYPNTAHKEKTHKYKHRDKYTDCLQKNISLLTIFDNEWNLKQEIVKSIVCNKLGKSNSRIYARSCKFSKISKPEADIFLDQNHIQGKCSYSDAYGLYYMDKLVSIMCFGKRKLTRGDSKYELIRFCNALHTSVIGGASKILKNSGISHCISYCDLRYSSGNLYEKLGMRLINTSPPNYFYTLDKIHLHHRINFQKHKISNINDPRTEWQIMYDNGYRRIYDCGNLVFEYSVTK
jgi:hypothetical protein